jgi:predicted nuclease of restriction endonuclease-like (RecB) superfamily
MMDTLELRSSQQAIDAVNLLKTAILQSQARAANAVNQEQLALYYGVGRFLSLNTRNKNWGAGMIKSISQRLRSEIPGLRGFGETNLRNMRLFYEAWSGIESNSSVMTDELNVTTSNAAGCDTQILDTDIDTIHQLRLMNLDNFPAVSFLSISFTHHMVILTHAKEWDERLFYIQYAFDRKLSIEELEKVLKKDLYHHQGQIPNNFLDTIPEYKQAYRAIQMFKDEYLLDFINVEELGMRDEDIDERVIEQSIVHNVKNFIMTFGKGFTFNGSQVHYDKFGHDHWIDLLFYNRDLRRLVVFELKKGKFKTSYLGQLSSYLRILNDDDRREGEEPPIGIILCKSADKSYVEYVMQDFRQPMGVATYKTADEMDAKLLEVLPSKEQLEKLLGD